MKMDLPYKSTSETGITNEFKVPLPCGHIAGKTWGDAKHPPVLCLHGWMDNCNSFDEIIPMLPQDYFYVAIDLLGHGLSSHLPAVGWYFLADNLATVKRVINYFKWENVILMGHSLGGNTSGYFAALYPELVKKCIVLDIVGVYIDRTENLVRGSRTKTAIETNLAYEKMSVMKKNPKLVTYEEAKKRMRSSEFGPQMTEKTIDILLQRGLKEEVPGKYSYRRDYRHAKNTGDISITSIQTAKKVYNHIKCDMLILIGNEGIFHVRNHNQRDEILKIASTMKNVNIEYVEGHHHVHLNNPVAVAPYITNFLKLREN